MKTVEDARLTKEIILSPDFRTYSMADRYRQLQARTKHDFSAAIRLLEYLPVFIDGDHHMRIRKAMAKQVSRTQKCQFSTSVEQLDQLIASKLLPGTEMDLVDDFAQPLWRAISGSIVPRNPAMLQLVDDVPALFSPILSIAKRIELCDRIEAFLNLQGEDEEDELILLCLATLGTRPFAGTLSLSLYEIIGSNTGKRFCEITWPEAFPVSSLRFVDRICLRPVSMVGHNFEAGERVRCFTQRSHYTVEENSSALFGFGSHTCLGKSISERVWKLVVAKLSQSTIKADCLGLTISPHNDPFYMAQEACIRLN